ncbi:hypothetical protein DL96DRAFT_1819764 [Flagelloscypha sp. PMI_526]|nr:hypothetical protein DL96DRAFT_1819764 [Flagelloscypha sp. PMI_526]
MSSIQSTGATFGTSFKSTLDASLQDAFDAFQRRDYGAAASNLFPNFDNSRSAILRFGPLLSTQALSASRATSYAVILQTLISMEKAPEHSWREVLLRVRSGLTESAFEALVKEYPRQMTRLGDVCLKYAESAVNAPGIQTQSRSAPSRTPRETERRRMATKTRPVTAITAATRMHEGPRSPKRRRVSENSRLSIITRPTAAARAIATLPKSDTTPTISPVPHPIVSSTAQTESHEVLILAPMSVETSEVNPPERLLRPLPSACKKREVVFEQNFDHLSPCDAFGTTPAQAYLANHFDVSGRGGSPDSASWEIDYSVALSIADEIDWNGWFFSPEL